MASNFAELKKQRTVRLEAIAAKLKEATGTNSYNKDDDRFWQPTVDKAGNGFAVIRFLPEPIGEDSPFVRLWSHGFKGPGGWYIENSLTTLKQPDPVSEYNTELWNSTNDDDAPARKQARNQKRKLTFISNILVVDDEAHPENNGKVFLYRYGKKLFDKINEKFEPQFKDETPCNIFDPWDGANLKLKVRNVEGYRNYDRSEFDNPTPIAKTDAEIKAICEKAYPLTPFVAPDQFKSYEELKSKLNRVLGLNSRISKDGEAAPVKQKEMRAEHEDVITGGDDDDEDIDYLRRLVNE